MSWAKDEWKQELPPKALQKISDMEKEYENLEKLRQQQDLKIDGYVTALEKGKMDLEEERSSSAALQKELQELKMKISNLEVKEERYLNEIKNKQKAVEYGEELLEKAKQKLKKENEKVVELEKSLEQRSTETEKYAERSDKMAVEIGNLKQEKVHISKENDSKSSDCAFIISCVSDVYFNSEKVGPNQNLSSFLNFNFINFFTILS